MYAPHLNSPVTGSSGHVRTTWRETHVDHISVSEAMEDITAEILEFDTYFPKHTCCELEVSESESLISTGIEF